MPCILLQYAVEFQDDGNRKKSSHKYGNDQEMAVPRIDNIGTLRANISNESHKQTRLKYEGKKHSRSRYVFGTVVSGGLNCSGHRTIEMDRVSERGEISARFVNVNCRRAVL